jgi:hypothetical protein
MVTKKAKLKFERVLLEENNFSINENATILLMK